MEITGKITSVLPERGGTSAKTGNAWKVATYVITTEEQYPRNMCFEVFGEDKIQQFNITAGEVLTVHFDIDANEYQGKWYNRIRAWKVSRGAMEQQMAQESGITIPQQAPAVAPAAAPIPPAINTAAQSTQQTLFDNNEEKASDLPF